MLGFKDENDFPNILNSWSSRLHPNDKDWVLNAFAKHITDKSGRTPYDVEYQLQMKTGEYRWFKAIGTTIRNREGVPLRVAGALFDIHNKKLEEQAQKEYTRLERLNLIGQLAAGISHEIRNPLTTVKGFLQLLCSRPDYTKDKENIKLMISEIDRANSIITDFLSLAKVNRAIFTGFILNISFMSLNYSIRNRQSKTGVTVK
jgi:signal transduction histidine kinase